MFFRSSSRRDFFKQTGGLAIAFSMVDATVLPRVFGAVEAGKVSLPDPTRLDAWLHIEKDGMVSFFTGKVEIGTGLQTAFQQIVAEELDISPLKVNLVQGDTALTPDQGGTGGSTSIAIGSRPVRNASATARLLLVQMASQKLGVPADQLDVKDGVVVSKADASKSITYAALAGGTDLNDTLKVSGAGLSNTAEGAGKPKPPSTYKVVGTSFPRVDIPAKVFGQYKFVTDVRVPGMVHGRVIRPAIVGANFVSVDETAVKQIPGFIQTVVKGNFVGVVAQSEWGAVRAAKELKVTWSDTGTPFPEDLYKHMRTVTPKSTRGTAAKGDVAAAMAKATKKIEASYEYPFHSHATMGPGCAVADYQANGVTTIWSGTQKPHSLVTGLAGLINQPLDRVRVIWAQDAGSYGRPGHDDTAADALMLSQAVGKPVRVQWNRADMTTWGAKGPAVAFDMTAAVDANGAISAVQFASHAFSGAEVSFLPDSPGNFLGAQLAGIKNTTGRDEFINWGDVSPQYAIDNIASVSHIVPPLAVSGSPLRTTHLRDPQGPPATFAVESFMDEIAAASDADPVDLRLKYMSEPRSQAVIKAAAEKSSWDRRPSPKRSQAGADVMTGRGIAFGNRGGTRVAIVAEVSVNRQSGVVKVTKMTCAHDCGLIVNPDGLRGMISGNLVQGTSRAIKEEVTFDRTRVTSADWKTYPIVRSSDVPALDIVLVNHPEAPSTGAGEPSIRPIAAAINNAIFDATGVRLRQVPFTPARVKAALASKV
jgi:nicotinate dehydrogenase subunit B